MTNVATASTARTDRAAGEDLAAQIRAGLNGVTTYTLSAQAQGIAAIARAREITSVGCNP